MSTTAQTVKESIESTIAGITPTLNGSVKFHLRSDDAQVPEDDSGAPSAERGFDVWHAGGETGEYHHPEEYEVTETYLVQVVYPFERDYRAQDNQIRKDVRDIKSALDNQANWGTDVLHQFVKAWSRPERIEDPGVWLQAIQVEVRFLEAA